MATRRALPSDPEYLLDLISDLPDESDSDDDFEGYLDPEDGPVAYRSSAELLEGGRITRSQSLENLSELHGLPESPLGGRSPSHSPMQGLDASSSPLAAGSSTQPCTSAESSSSPTPTSKVHY